MDLHYSSARATDEERAAIDEVDAIRALDQDRDGQLGRGGVARADARRHLLLPALHAVQGQIGWVSEGALNEICRRLVVPPADAYGVASFYGLLATVPRPPRVAHVCDDIACKLAGADALCAALARSVGPAGAPSADGRGSWVRSPCLGHCERGPAVLFQLAGAESDATVAPASIDAVGRVLRGDPVAAQPVASPTPTRSSGGRLLRRVGRVDPGSLAAYRTAGGYDALERALDLGPARIIAEVVTSKLQGRGGAAFPTGRKWQAVANASALPHYVVCNADESEPGTFKDRVLMEDDPFAVVESMTIAGYAVGAEHGYLYIRGEYPLAAERLRSALAAARDQGLLGTRILGRDVRFDIEIRRGAGAYICGEETALFNSVEGFRGEPRNKPPFPTEAGLFGKPTVVNNVETLVNVLDIVLEGGSAFASAGSADSTGSKLFCVSGTVERPGLYEEPFGATLRQVIDLAGGVRAGRTLRTVLLGGAAGSFVGPDSLDVPLTFEGTKAIGASVGSGVVMVFDDEVNMIDIVQRIAAFFRDESCGQCVPCRVGTVRQEELLARIASGRADASGRDTVALVDDLARVMRDASICGLGHTAASAVQSAIALQLIGARP